MYVCTHTVTQTGRNRIFHVYKNKLKIDENTSVSECISLSCLRNSITSQTCLSPQASFLFPGVHRDCFFVPTPTLFQTLTTYSIFWRITVLLLLFSPEPGQQCSWDALGVTYMVYLKHVKVPQKSPHYFFVCGCLLLQLCYPISGEKRSRRTVILQKIE